MFSFSFLFCMATINDVREKITKRKKNKQTKNRVEYK